MAYAWCMHGICMVYAWHMHGVCILSTRSRRASSASTQTPSLTLALLLAPTLTANQALTSIKARAPRPIPRRPRWPRRERRRRNCSPSRYRTDHEVPRCPTCRRIPRSSSTRYAASRMSCVRGFKLLATHHAPRTTHHAPRTTHHAPRTTHHAPRTTHFSRCGVASRAASNCCGRRAAARAMHGRRRVRPSPTQSSRRCA
jgi:hypothetical protein